MGSNDMSDSIERPARVYPGAPKDVAASSLTNEAYEALKASILEGILPPGYQAVEKQLAHQLEMSRTPVHEAIIRLQNEGFLRILPRRGVQILKQSPNDIRRTYEVIIALEGMAARLLAGMEDRQAAAAGIALMTEATDAMEDAFLSGDVKQWANADDRFHRSLIEKCGNAKLGCIAGTFMDQAQLARVMTLRIRPLPSISVREHRSILASLEAGNGSEARQAVEEHRARACKEITEALSLL
jgi:DNA-binding GntR family transcriptional regulator